MAVDVFDIVHDWWVGTTAAEKLLVIAILVAIGLYLFVRWLMTPRGR